jgi:hypothetical protein
MVGFDDQVDVVRLQGELGQTEPEAIAPESERAEDPGADEVSAKAGEALAYAQSHVERMARVMVRALAMRDSSAGARGLASGAFSCAAPRLELELLLAKGAMAATHREILLSPSWTAPSSGGCRESLDSLRRRRSRS